MILISGGVGWCPDRRAWAIGVEQMARRRAPVGQGIRSRAESRKEPGELGEGPDGGAETALGLDHQAIARLQRSQQVCCLGGWVVHQLGANPAGGHAHETKRGESCPKTCQLSWNLAGRTGRRWTAWLGRVTSAKAAQVPRVAPRKTNTWIAMLRV
jgi:hypothetical protein